MESKTYTVDELFEDIPGDPENVLFNIPLEICKELNLNIGDTVNITAENGCLIIKKHG